MRPIITLTTDFGEGSPYVAQMKASILSISPDARIVDITHGIAPQRIAEAAVVLDDVARRFPAGSIHVAVVDPGVGTQRDIACLVIGEQTYVLPDNGLATLLLRRMRPQLQVAVREPRYWLEVVSATFHGRDIMAPVAAHLSCGVEPEQLGPPLEQLVELDWPVVERHERQLVGSVLLADHFGNLITNISESELAEAGAERPRVTCGDRPVEHWVRTYGEHPPGTLVALLGSSGRLEVSLVQGNAAAELQVGAGAKVTVDW